MAFEPGRYITLNLGALATAGNHLPLNLGAVSGPGGEVGTDSSETLVTASAYPLGNDGDTPAEFLKFTVVNSTLQGRSVSPAITRGYLTGRGMKLRQAYKYARTRFSWGVPFSGVYTINRTDRVALTASLQAQHPGHTIEFKDVRAGGSDFVYWGEWYLATQFGWDRDSGKFWNPPAGVHPDATVSFDISAPHITAYNIYGEPMGYGASDALGVKIKILMVNPDNSVKLIEWTPNRYETFSNPSDMRLPDFYWNTFSYVHARYRTVKTYPTEVVRSSRAFVAGDTTHTTTDVTAVLVAGEKQETTKVTIMTVSGGTTSIEVRSTLAVTSRIKLYVFRVYSPYSYDPFPGIGPAHSGALDTALEAAYAPSGAYFSSPYFPAVPLRVNNVDVTNEAHRSEELYKTSKKLLNKVGIDMQDLADRINENESINEIDYAFVVFGVSLNAEAQECRRYLHAFFEHLRGLNPGDIEFYHHELTEGMSSVIKRDWCTMDLYHEHHSRDNYNIRLRWLYITTTQKPGVIFSGARVGDCILECGAQETYHGDDRTALYSRKQLDEDTYEELEIRGLTYTNHVYDGKAVIISAYEQFNDVENGFIVPLNIDVVRSLGMVVSTDLGYSCTHIVFNSYKVVKKKWYEEDWFKVLLVIVAIVITVWTMGSDGGASLGYALAYSAAAAFGVTGVLLTYLAATLYVLAMMIIANIVAKVAVDAFGDKWGQVIAAVVMIVVGNYAATGTFTGTLGTTGLNAASIIQASQAVVNIYGKYTQGAMAELQDEAMELQTEEKLRMKELQALMKQLGTNDNSDLIDIEGMTKASYTHLYERMDTFLSRTLVTGSDVAEITNGMVSNFAEVGLQLPTNG